ncbi:MAG: DUF6445 family protein [Sphingomicrobium sp.]
MTPALIVIDDFLVDPLAFRHAALRLNYDVEGPYPGRNSAAHIRIEGLERLAASFVHEPLRAPWPPESHGRCRLALAADDTPGRIHIDPSYWSGMLYLSLPEQCRGGTEFYRHLPTGTDRVPRSIEEINAVGYASYDELKQQVMERDTIDRSKWALTTTVSMRFNRLVLIQPHYWHTSGAGFGNSVEDGRLVYLMFFWRAGG